MWHRHNWQEIARTYAPPGPFLSWSGPAYVYQQVLLGVTTVLWECIDCQDQRKQEMLGKECPTKATGSTVISSC